MNVQQMEEFIDLVKQGKNASGSVNKTMTCYNDGVKYYRDQYVTNVLNKKTDPLKNLTRKQIIKLGKELANDRTFAFRIMNLRVVALSIVAGLIANGPRLDGSGFLGAAGDSEHFRLGLAALKQGDWQAAEFSWFGGPPESSQDNFYLYLWQNTNPQTAEAFAKAYMAVKAKYHQEAADILNKIFGTAQ